jgi:hypothetical protein
MQALQVNNFLLLSAANIICLGADVMGKKIVSLKTKLRGFSPQGNYTDRATADCR